MRQREKTDGFLSRWAGRSWTWPHGQQEAPFQEEATSLLSSGDAAEERECMEGQWIAWVEIVNEILYACHTYVK